jgi:hypothetical protein
MWMTSCGILLLFKRRWTSDHRNVIILNERRMMIRKLLIFWGYIKVPKEAIFLSTKLENIWREVVETNPDTELYLEIQKTLTKFLRSGRM